MATRLNYTRRTRLTSDDFGIQVNPVEGAPATFDVTMNLEHLRPAHDDARVYIEAYRQSVRMRFGWGTVAHLAPPPDRRLVEFDDWRRVLFRIRVTNNTDDPGRVIAWRNQIKPTAPRDARSGDLLYFENADLEGRVWDLRFDDELGPVVLIDQRAGDRHDVGGDPRFQAATFPEILRRVLWQALVIERENGDDEDHWSYSWLQGFLKPQLKLADPPPLDDDDSTARRDWIEDAVRAFAHRHAFSSLWNPETGERA